MKSLVIFYSQSSNTKLAAKTIAEELKADIMRVEEVNRRSRAGLYFAGGMAAARDKSSDIKPLEINMDDYGRIFLGSPVWAGKPVPAINAFIKNTDFKGKEVVVFFTAGGDKFEKTVQNISQKIENSGGKVVGSFGVSTARNTPSGIERDTLAAIASYGKE